MRFSLLFVFLSWILLKFSSTSASGERDRELYFPAYYFYAERRLMNHMITTVLQVKNLDDCEYLCYLEDACISLNIKNMDSDGTHECELNNSTHMEHGQDLVDNPIYYYRGAKNNCRKSGRSPCLNNATCQSGFTYKGYRCSCTPGFEGEQCEKDVNECDRRSHKCHVNATCINTKGSYHCSCKEGYSGDGHNCTDIDECATGNHNCNSRHNFECSNTDGSFICRCANGYVNSGGTCKVSANCADYYKAGERKSGVYTINPDGSDAFDVFCDHTTARGGWTVFQKRWNGSVDFYRNWADYQRGFGDLNGEFWLGLDKINRLTSSGLNKLRVDLEDFARSTSYAEYDSFAVGNGGTNYKLGVGRHSGTAEDSLTKHNGFRFSTKDQDNDVSTAHCAVNVEGAWWFYDCRDSSLNGVYYHGKSDGQFSDTYCIKWGSICPVKRTEMKIRPTDY